MCSPNCARRGKRPAPKSRFHRDGCRGRDALSYPASGWQVDPLAPARARRCGATCERSRARAFFSISRRPVAIATYAERLLNGERGAQFSRATRLIGKGPAGAAEAEEASTTAVRGRVLVVGLDGAGKTSIVQLLATPERRARAPPPRSSPRACRAASPRACRAVSPSFLPCPFCAAVTRESRLCM